MPTATASAKLLDPILQVARHFQQEPDALLEQLGIESAAIRTAGTRIPAELFGELLQRLANLTDNPRIALRAGEATEPRLLGSVGFMMSTSETLADAFQILNDYMPLLIEGVHISLQRQLEQGSLVLDLQHEDRPLAEWLLACLYNWPRWLTGHQFPLLQVELRFEEPPSAQLYEQFFAAEVSFQAPRYRLTFPVEMLDYPCLDANEALHRHHRQFADQLLSSAGRDGALAAQVKSLIRNQLIHGERISREQIASQLNTSLRTLQRKLDKQQTSLQAIYDQTRQEMALQLIHRADQSLGEVAYQLGFSGLSAFQKAFKRWTGSTPGHYRKTHHPHNLLQPDNSSLQEMVANKVLDNRQFLSLSLQLVEQLQSANTLSTCLHPSLIRITQHPSGNIQASLEPSYSADQLPLTEQLAYMAPERSGLLPYPPDQRTLTYELGCLFWFMLHAQPPQGAEDLSSLLRRQLNDSPIVRQSLPATLGGMLKKLLSLEQDARYQSLAGLQYDLQSLQLTGTATYEGFTPARQDNPAPLPGPAPLIGRQTELLRLRQLLSDCRHQQGKLLMLGGEAGVGKSTLLAQLYPEIYRTPTELLAINLKKGDERQQLTPILPALRVMLRRRLAAPPAQQTRWRDWLTTALEEPLPLLISRLPELAQFCEQQPTTATRPLGQYAQQLANALESLILLQREPLVLIIDNLEYASGELISLMQEISNQLSDKAILMIGSYCAERLTSQSPLQQALPKLLHHPKSEQLTLNPLTQQELNQLIDKLMSDNQYSRRLLASQLWKQCSGNPQRLSDQLQQRIAQHKLHYDAKRDCWQAFAPLPPKPQLTTRSALLHQLTLLPATSHELLQWAALIGNPFNLQQLAWVRQDPITRLIIHLWPATQAGLIQPIDTHTEQGHFIHPELVEILVASLPLTQKRLIHQAIGQMALEHPEQPDSRSLAATHLQAARPDKINDQQAVVLAKQHIDAANSYQQQGHYPKIVQHLQDALKLFADTKHWQPEPSDLPLLEKLLISLLPHTQQLQPELERLEQRLRRGQGHSLMICQRAYQLLIAQKQQDAVQLLCQALAEKGVQISSTTQTGLVATSPKGDQQTLGYLLDSLQLCAEVNSDTQLLYRTLQTGVALHRPDTEPAAALLNYQLYAKPLPLVPNPTATEEKPLMQQWLSASRILPWCAPLSCSIESMERLLNSETGAQDPRRQPLLLPLYFSKLWGEESLPALQQSLKLTLPEADQQTQMQPECLRLTQLLHNLQQPKPNPVTPTPLETGWSLVSACINALLSDQRDQWPMLINATERASFKLSGLLAEAQLLHCSALMAAELLHNATPSARQQWLRHLHLQTSRFQLWADHNPTTFTLPSLLLKAELAAATQQTDTAITLFEKLISNAEQSDNQLLKILSYRRYAAFWQHRHATHLSTLLQGRENDCLKRWRQG